MVRLPHSQEESKPKTKHRISRGTTKSPMISIFSPVSTYEKSLINQCLLSPVMKLVVSRVTADVDNTEKAA